jgi:hypothetical protein
MARRMIWCSVVLIVAVCQLAAQTAPDFIEPSTYSSAPSDELLALWLHSNDPRVEAWAAHFIESEDRVALVTELTSALVRAESKVTPTQPTHSADWHRALPLLVDPFLLPDFALKPTLIESLPLALEGQRAVLLSRLDWETAGPIWLMLYRPNAKDGHVTTRVAAEMLARHPLPTFAARLLATVSVRTIVWVNDPDSGMSQGVGRRDCGSIGVSLDPLPWPDATGVTLLAPTKQHPFLPDGTQILVGGIDPIYTLHWSGANRYETNSCNGFARLDDEVRSHLVGTLLGGMPAAPFPIDIEQLQISFTNREAYRRTVADYVEALQATFAQVTDRLTAAGLLTERERQSASLSIRLQLRDTRRQPALDLPPIVFRPPVEWVGASGSF